jgi:hypothetical protein
MSTDTETFDPKPTLDQSAFGLSHDADCLSPDRKDSPGAVFLLRIQDSVLDDLDRVLGDEHDASDLAHEIADQAVPIYTHHLWEVFVDLGAYQEDPTELGYDGSDLTQSAQAAIYLIASRLAHSLMEKVREAHEEWVEEQEAEATEEETDEGEGAEA